VTPEQSAVRRLRRLCRALDDEVADEVLEQGSARLRLLGEGVPAIVAGLARLAPRATRSVWNLQPQYAFDPADQGFELTDAARARGLDLTLVTTPVSARRNPLLGSIHPETRVGPVFTQGLLVDDRLMVVGGPRSAAGAATAWTSVDPELVSRMREIWELTVQLSEPLVREDTPVLDRRRLEVACLIARGETDQAMARRLEVSLRTVERDVQAVLQFLGARGRAEAVLVMRGRGVNGGEPL
jgi:DNA-binding CsgD family transcriptional regulator